MSISEDKKVKDITLGELKKLIREVLLEVVDPDYGLELSKAAFVALQESIQQKERGEGVPLKEAKDILGLD